MAYWEPIRALGEVPLVKPGSTLKDVTHDIAVVTETRYGKWLKRIVSGELGVSLVDGEPILSKLRARAPMTLWLCALATLVSWTLAVPIGAIGAWWRGGAFDVATSAALFLLYAIPTFVVAELLRRAAPAGHEEWQVRKDIENFMPLLRAGSVRRAPGAILRAPLSPGPASAPPGPTRGTAARTPTPETHASPDAPARAPHPRGSLLGVPPSARAARDQPRLRAAGAWPAR